MQDRRTGTIKKALLPSLALPTKVKQVTGGGKYSREGKKGWTLNPRTKRKTKKDIQKGPGAYDPIPEMPKWLRPHFPHQFNDFEKMGLSRRQKGLLAALITESKEFKVLPDAEQEPLKAWKRLWQDGGFIPKVKIELLIGMKLHDEETAPPYRKQAERLAKIRKDHKWSAAQFAEKLSKPEGEEPFPNKEYKFTARQINDLEYGNRKIDITLAAICFHKFRVLGEWLLEGKGTPFTRTDVLTIDRVVDVEKRMTDIENHTKTNFGLDVLKTLGGVNHPGVWRDVDGNWHMDNATNTALRLGLDMAMSEIKTLKTIIEYNKETLKDQRDLIRALRKELEQVEDHLKKVETSTRRLY